ncbi:ankyrin repeat-containing domain protein [Parachaetomium inaequale]|uniref:Ankyrin repeat-containing domain protein n=1 Tax=Parachaetomium inaequale TaxID=2588326 RepID=A0AAN6PRG2_9PEZI|nr:ankyrin repeat-containing domain protein [Parachaetomium inaequale]
MRLLNTKKLRLEDFGGDSIPLYAILSHRWGSDEITLKDIENPGGGDGAGYKKVRKACETAANHGLQYIWVDTCCIDKTSSAELSEAINSMYRWYQESVVCYAYLADVPFGADPECLESEWFTRGWTLQELIAPSTVIFLDQSWQEIGTKSSLRSVISRITGIPVTVLKSGDVESASVAQRMSWASKRETTRVEDRAYSLMGLFGVHMPMVYGEGERAFIRLQEEIMRLSDDHSLFAWASAGSHGGLLAPSPSAFANSGRIIPLDSSTTLTGTITTSNKGIDLRLDMVPIHTESHPRIELGILPCAVQGEEDKQVAIYLCALSETMEYFSRFVSTEFKLVDPREFPCNEKKYLRRSICVRWERRISGNRSPLVKAAEQANKTVIKLLLERGVDLEDKDQSGRTALSRAAEQGHKKIVKLLLQGGANVESEDRSGRTPLSWAAERGHKTVVRLLLEKGADIESKDRRHWMPLIWAMENGHAGVAPIVMLGIGGQLDITEHEGKSIPTWAAAQGHTKLVELLLNEGVDCESRDQTGRTPLSWAAEGGHEDIILLLLERAVVNQQKAGTPLASADASAS